MMFLIPTASTKHSLHPLIEDLWSWTDPLAFDIPSCSKIDPMERTLLSLCDSLTPQTSSLSSPGLVDMHMRFDKDRNKYVIETPTPGVKRDELKLEVVGGNTLELTIEQGRAAHKGNDQAEEDKAEEDKDKGSNHNSEIHRFVKRSVTRSIRLPRGCDLSDMHVTYQDGLLKVEVSKAAPPAITDGESSGSKSSDADSENAELVEDIKAKRAKIDDLRKQLQEERKLAEEAETRLKEARVEARRKKASERSTVGIE